MRSIELPDSTKKRLAQLLQLLKKWPEQKITSVAISEATGWKNSLIRHDLWLIQFNKGISNGYLVSELTEAIELVLGIKTCDTSKLSSNDANGLPAQNRPVEVLSKNLCIVGLGRLGAALLDTNLFLGTIFTIKAGFDSNLNRVEILRSTFPLYPASEMDFVLKKEDIKYAVLTVSDKDAQQMADRLVKAGVTGIVNMTNVLLKVPARVKVENISILNSLNLVI